MTPPAPIVEPPVADLISVAEAIRILDAIGVSPRVSELNLVDAAGYRLAADLVADRDHPPFEKAVMDGYAVRAGDVSIGSTLVVVDTAHAGGAVGRSVCAGEAVAIMTGAPVPAGADAVVPVEHTSRVGNRVTCKAAARVGQAIAGRGSDVAAGVVVLKKGARLGPPQVAVAATVGAARPAVFARPRVAVLSTGDELVDIDQTPAGPQIRNSNGPMLVALLRELGCDVRNLGNVGDDRARLRGAIEDGLRADVLFVTGGMSMGERDYVPGLFRELGLELKISKLRIKPGKPFVFAADGRRLAFGLPGNPVSAFVCTARLAWRILSRMAGGSAEASLGTARVNVPLMANGPREFYQPATWDGQTVTPLTWKGSADLFTLARANALLIRPENAPAATAGEVVPILRLP